MKDSEDSIWTRKTHRTFLDDADDLAYVPSGGPMKRWIAGFIIASLPIIYGIHCIQRGDATLFGSRGNTLKLVGDAGLSLAIAYISIGGFLHFHYFWRLSDRLWRFSQALKVLSLIVFLLSFLYALYLALL
jgi:hypothetical protein